MFDLQAIINGCPCQQPQAAKFPPFFFLLQTMIIFTQKIELKINLYKNKVLQRFSFQVVLATCEVQPQEESLRVQVGTGRLDSFPKLGFQDNEDGSSTEGCKIY